MEERIEMICNRLVLEHVLEETKKAHSYPAMVIDVFPIYEMGMKKAKWGSKVGACQVLAFT